MHIHPSSPNSTYLPQSEENAAIKIQAGFRGYRVRKQLHQQTRSSTNGYHTHRYASYRQQRQKRAMENQNVAAASNGTMSTGTTGMSSAMSQLHDERSSGSESVSVEDRCATKIQAGVRGFLVRKKQKIASEAATKIQAGFRGFKVRKETQKLKEK